jgi:hypothetical protein
MVSKRHDSGQMLLITLLVLAIATTIALSVIGRTTTDLNISTQLEESSRAFSAAEAGIEQALKLQSNPNNGNLTTLAGGASYQVSSSTLAGTAGTYIFPNLTSDGQSQSLWLVDHNTDGTPNYASSYSPANNLTVCWSAGATELVLYFSRSGEIMSARQAYDSDNARVGAQAESNRFSPAVSGSGCAGASTSYLHTINFATDFSINNATDKLIMLRIIPYYVPSGTQLAVSSGSTIPSQGNSFESCGTTGGGVKRCINVYQNYHVPPLDYVLYANGNGASLAVQ